MLNGYMTLNGDQPSLRSSGRLVWPLRNSSEEGLRVGSPARVSGPCSARFKRESAPTACPRVERVWLTPWREVSCVERLDVPCRGGLISGAARADLDRIARRCVGVDAVFP